MMNEKQIIRPEGGTDEISTETFGRPLDWKPIVAKSISDWSMVDGGSTI